MISTEDDNNSAPSEDLINCDTCSERFCPRNGGASLNGDAAHRHHHARHGETSSESDSSSDGDYEAIRSSLPPLCSLSEKCVEACQAYGRVCPYVAKSAGRAATRACRKLSEDSKVFVGKPNISHFNCDDLKIGKLLGHGGFSEVHEVTISSPSDSIDTSSTEHGTDCEGVVIFSSTKHDNRKKGASQQKYAVKFLKRRIMVEKRNFERGAADLAIESRFLSTLSHPNIVKLHGVTAGSVETNVATGRECGFFLVLDRLYDTLEDRIELWREENTAKYGSLISRMTQDFKGTKRRALLMKRMEVALDIADVMRYLHGLNIIFRDLKPDNIGFDADDVVKLFDFGLAKELRPSKEKEDGTYVLSGNTGSKRYMAPEVARNLHYNLKADVYSFGILLYEISSLEKPFAGYNSARHMQEIVLGKKRPKIDTGGVHSFWPSALVDLIRRCWHDDPNLRPTFDEVVAVLRNMVEEGGPESIRGSDELQQQGVTNFGQGVDTTKPDQSGMPRKLGSPKFPKRVRGVSWGGKKDKAIGTRRERGASIG